MNKLLLISYFLTGVQSLEGNCFYDVAEVNFFGSEINQYTCQFRDIRYIDTTNGFQIIGGEHQALKDDSQVRTVHAVQSNFHSVPMEIFEKFQNLQHLSMEFVELQELEPFTNCNQMTMLSFYGNKLESIGKVFDECTELVGLSLENNRIATIDGDAIRNLNRLELFLFEDNELRELADHFFEGAPKLTYVILQSNNFLSIPKAFGKGLEMLKCLRLGSNPYEKPNDISKAFGSNLASVDDLCLFNSNIEEILEGTFKGLKALITLKLNNNHISYLQAGCFNGLTMLETLLLQGNNLVQIDSMIFQQLLSLEWLELQDNWINEFADGTFVGLNKLKFLDIGLNSFMRLKMAAFGKLENVDTLLYDYGSDEGLKTLSRAFFTNLPNLKILDSQATLCGGIKFYNFNDDDLVHFESCFARTLSAKFDDKFCVIVDANVQIGDEVLMIDGYNSSDNVKFVTTENSRMKFIPQVICNDFPKLFHLTLRVLGLMTIENLDNCFILEYLDVEGNQLEAISPVAFKNCAILKRLFLSHNYITAIHGKSFNNLKQLELLSLHHNRLTFLDAKLFVSLETITSLDLHDNWIEEFADGMFFGLGKLQTLDISINKLSSLRVSSFGQLNELASLRMSSNNIHSMSRVFLTNFPSLKEVYALENSCVSTEISNYTNADLVHFEGCFAGVLMCNYGIDECGCKFCEIVGATVKAGDEITMIDGDSERESVLNVYAKDSKLDFIPQVFFNDFKSLTKFEWPGVDLVEVGKLDNCSMLSTLILQSNVIKELREKFLEKCKILKELILWLNEIYSIHERAFNNLKLLETLELNGNPLAYLHPNTFDSLVELKSLRLEYSKLVRIDPKTFQNLAALQSLTLYYNELDTIEDRTFAGLLNLTYLDLSGNKIEYLRMTSFDMEFPALREFYFDHNELENISPLFFTNFPNPLDLRIRENVCVKYDEYDLSNFTAKDLIHFEACFERVLTCDYGVYEGEASCEIVSTNVTTRDQKTLIDGNGANNNVKSVHVNENSSLKTIPQIIFDQFPKLSKVHFTNVGLKELNEIDHCLSLTYLNLEDNDIQDLPEKAFAACGNLKELLLSGNAIIYIREGAFVGLGALRTLHIANAKTKMPSLNISMSPRSFQGLQELEQLHLELHYALDIGSSLNSLSDVYTVTVMNNEITQIKNDIFGSSRILGRVILSHNKISSIQQGSFDTIRLMTFLDLSNNDLVSLPLMLFAKNEILITLLLSNNKFTALPVIGESLECLKFLYFDNNQLVSLATTYEFPQLQNLSFTRNQISSVTKLFFRPLSRLRQLNFYGNSCWREDFDNIDNMDTSVLPMLKVCFENFVIETSCIFSDTRFGYSCKFIEIPDKVDNSDSSDRQHLDGRSDYDVKYVDMKNRMISIDLNLIVKRFSNLEKIQLWQGSMEDSNAFESCTRLATLDVRKSSSFNPQNNLLSNCLSLTTLILAASGIQEIAENSIAIASKLHHLDLSFNEIKVIAKSFFNKATKLRILKLSHNRFSSEILDTIARLEVLQVLDLGYNNIDVVNSKSFLTLPLLRELHLNNNRITEIISDPNKIEVFPKLIHLNLADNVMTKLDFPSEDYKKLQYLDISMNKILTIQLDLKAQSHLTTFIAFNNECIDKSFEVVEISLDEVIAAVSDCV